MDLRVTGQVAQSESEKAWRVRSVHAGKKRPKPIVPLRPSLVLENSKPKKKMQSTKIFHTKGAVEVLFSKGDGQKIVSGKDDIIHIDEQDGGVRVSDENKEGRVCRRWEKTHLLNCTSELGVPLTASLLKSIEGFAELANKRRGGLGEPRRQRHVDVFMKFTVQVQRWQ